MATTIATDQKGSAFLSYLTRFADIALTYKEARSAGPVGYKGDPALGQMQDAIPHAAERQGHLNFQSISLNNGADHGDCGNSATAWHSVSDPFTAITLSPNLVQSFACVRQGAAGGLNEQKL